MRIVVLLLGLAALLAALVIADAQAYLADSVVHANAKLAGTLFTIPLAAVVDL